MDETRELNLWRKIRLRLIASAGIAAAVMLGWWMRVERARTPETTPVIGLGTTVVTGRSAVTPMSVQFKSGADELVLVAEVRGM